VGAAFVAVAALVFAYSGLVGDPGVRRTVLAVVTVVAAATTLVLRRRGLTASADAVGGLTVVLGLIAVHLLSGAAHGPARQVLLAGAGLVWAVVLAGAGRRLALRAWRAGGLLVAPVAVTALAWADVLTTPAVRTSVVLLLATAVAAVSAALERRWRAGRRTLTAESVMLTVEAVAAGLVASGAVLVASFEPSWATTGHRTFVPGLVLVGLGLVALALGRARPGWWTWVAGAYLVGGAAWTTMLVTSTGAHPSPMTVFGTVVVTAALAWAVLGALAQNLDPGRFRSVLAGGWLVTVALAAPLAVVTLVAVVQVLGDPFGRASQVALAQTLTNPGWADGWLPGAWLALGLAWAWYAVLPRTTTARHPRPAPEPTGPATTSPAPALDPEDLLVLVGHPHGHVEVPFTRWVTTGPGPWPGARLRAARLRSTGEPVPLTQVDDPWRRPPRTNPLGSLAAAAGAAAPLAVGGAVAAAGLLPGLPVWAS